MKSQPKACANRWESAFAPHPNTQSDRPEQRNRKHNCAIFTQNRCSMNPASQPESTSSAQSLILLLRDVLQTPSKEGSA
jgi:hypothetical protein